MQENINIYTIISTGADADQGFFPEPEVYGSYLSLDNAREEMWRIAQQENETLGSCYDSEDYGPDFWMRYRDGEAAGCFFRVEILTSQLMDGSDHQ